MTTIQTRIRDRLEGEAASLREDAEARYRRAVRDLAADPNDERSLAAVSEAMHALGLTPGDVEGDVQAVRKASRIREKIAEVREQLASLRPVGEINEEFQRVVREHREAEQRYRDRRSALEGEFGKPSNLLAQITQLEGDHSLLWFEHRRVLDKLEAADG